MDGVTLETFITMLKDFGPFTTPLCIAMAFAIRWLLKDRERLLQDLKDSRTDATNIRDKRMEDQRAAAVEFRQYGEAITHRLEEWQKTADKALDQGKR